MALRVAFIGGGSGGHLFPAVAIAQELIRQDPESRFLFLTSHRPVDRIVLASSGLSKNDSQIVPYVSLSSKKGLLNNAAQLLPLWRSLRQARRGLKDFQPDIVVGLGALASVPGVVAGSRLGLPIVLLEQNCLPGRATRVLSRRAKLTVFGLKVPENQLLNWPSPVKTCGTPVRAVIRELTRWPIDQIAGRNRILILGGSQGSQSVNQLVTAAICHKQLVPEDWEIVHQTGESQVESVRTQYRQHRVEARVAGFLPDMCAELAGAGIVVCRAGAVTIQELACAGVPSILIPLSTAAENHQMLNARLLEGIGAAVVIDEGNPEAPSIFATALTLLFGDPDTRQRMAYAARSIATPEAATEIAGVLCDIAAENT